MRLLILSEIIEWKQKRGDTKYTAPYDVNLIISNLNDSGSHPPSAFDYDVTVIHIAPGIFTTTGYFDNIPKMFLDVKTALENGRSIICLPASDNFRSRKSESRRPGDQIYDWLNHFGIALRTNDGVDIKPSGAGKAHVIKEYLKDAPAYFQIVIQPKIEPQNYLAVVDDTEIVVGFQQIIEKGTLVILPPPRLGDEYYFLSMSKLVNVAKHYYEKDQRKIPLGDEPDWVNKYFVPEALDINRQIKELQQDKLRYDRIAYVLYGTGEELEDSVSTLLQELGLVVEPEPPGANIDLIAKHDGLNLGFAFEVTGTKGIVRKDTNKIAQAWQYLQDRAGTPQENDRLVLVANTEYHLEPSRRGKESYTKEVIKLLGNNEVLLLTTIQLYELWKAVHQSKRSKEDVITELHNSYGLYKLKH